MLRVKIFQLEIKIKELQDLLEIIVVTEGVDTGVVLLSYESTTHYDEDSKCQVYDNAYFSPLGDALIEMRDGLEQLKQEIKEIIEL